METASSREPTSANFCDENKRGLALLDSPIKLFGKDIALAKGIKHGEEQVPAMTSYAQNTADEARSPDHHLGSFSNEVGSSDKEMKEIPASLVVRCDMPAVDESHNPGGHEKAFKKPEKVLPCPRCNSMDTKFCYFNNYNVNQPRHFCKQCQRYWTAGGMLRNVPIGAGRRKSKPSVFQNKSVTRALHIAENDVSHSKGSSSVDPTSKNGSIQSTLRSETCGIASMDIPVKTAICFGKENPLCDSMAATSLNVQHMNGSNMINGVNPEASVKSPLQNGMTQPGLETKTSSNFYLKSGFGDSIPALREPFKPNLLYEPGVFKNGYPDLNFGIPRQYNGTAGPPLLHPLAWPLWSPPSFPWNTTWGPAAAAAAAAMAAAATAAAVAATASNAQNVPPSLPGHKHKLEGAPSKSANEGCLLVPKTLRIQDPIEAARSSIWTELGLGGFPGALKPHTEKAFNAMLDQKVSNEIASLPQHVNPAALLRSNAFQERS